LTGQSAQELHYDLRCHIRQIELAGQLLSFCYSGSTISFGTVELPREKLKRLRITVIDVQGAVIDVAPDCNARAGRYLGIPKRHGPIGTTAEKRAQS